MQTCSLKHQKRKKANKNQKTTNNQKQENLPKCRTNSSIININKEW